jgi:hypothetical protein
MQVSTGRPMFYGRAMLSRDASVLPWRPSATWPLPAAIVAGVVTSVAQGQAATVNNAGSAPPRVHGCRKHRDSKPGHCRIMQRLSIERGGRRQRLLTVIVRPEPGAKNIAVSLLTADHGPAGGPVMPSCFTAAHDNLAGGN